MGKAATKKTVTTLADESTQQYLDVLSAKNKFFVATLGMGWRLALTVLIPLIGGVKLDERLSSSPSYTLAGLILAACGGTAAVWSSVKQLNEEQAEEEKLEHDSEINAIKNKEKL